MLSVGLDLTSKFVLAAIILISAEDKETGMQKGIPAACAPLNSIAMQVVSYFCMK